MNSWEHRCFANDTGEDKICATELHARENGQELVLYFARGKTGPVPLVAQGQVGEYREMTIRVDDLDPVPADHCQKAFCYYEKEKSHQLIRQFKRGRIAQILIEDQKSGVLFQTEITLMGFSAAFGMY
ncbi:MAG: invasion associated locus B family protein [Pseudomonadota bacterium]